MEINFATIDLSVEGALLSTLAYKEYEAALLQRHPNVKIINVKNARAVLIDSPEFMDVIFAGSDDYKDWMGNILRNKVSRDGIGKVYKGVADYYSLLRNSIHENIPDPMKPQRVFGHSLGGACAEMYATRRFTKGKPVISLNTYGAPMVGDEYFCEESSKVPNAYNWWIKGDVVPYQPKVAGMFSIGYERARPPCVVDGIKITHKVPLWLPPIAFWIRRGLAHSCYEGYYKGLASLRDVYK